MVVMKKIGESRSERLFDEGCEASARGDLKKAREKFTASSALVPDALTLCNLGVIHERLGDVESAVKCYARACKLEARDPVPRVNLGDALVRQNRFMEASKAYTSALKLRVGEPWLCLNNLGVAYEKMGNPEKATACYKKAIEIKPQYDLARQNYFRMVKQKHQSVIHAYAVPVDDREEDDDEEKNKEHNHPSPSCRENIDDDEKAAAAPAPPADSPKKKNKMNSFPAAAQPEEVEDQMFDGSEILRKSPRSGKAPCTSCGCSGPSADLIGWWFGCSSSPRRRR